MRTRPWFMVVVGLSLLVGEARAETVTFDFNNAPNQAPLPLSQTVGGITASFTATGTGYSIQQVGSGTLGVSPAGFSGLCLCPNGISVTDLLIAFSKQLTDASILYAPQELATDTSCTMRISAYMGSTAVGTHTNVISPPGVWPTGTLAFHALNSTQWFDHIVIHYDKAPTGDNYGTFFLADNLLVTPAPEPGGVAMLLAAVVGFLIWQRFPRV